MDGIVVLACGLVPLLLIAALVYLVKVTNEEKKAYELELAQIWQSLPPEQSTTFMLYYDGRKKDPVVAVVLALFLGGIGGHQFYLGKTGFGILYLLFCLTGIPSLIAFFEAFVLSKRVHAMNRQAARETAAMFSGVSSGGRYAQMPKPVEDHGLPLATPTPSLTPYTPPPVQVEAPRQAPFSPQAATVRLAGSTHAVAAQLINKQTNSAIKIPVWKERVAIGRNDPTHSVDIDLTDHNGEGGGVSRQHATLLVASGGYALLDNQSANGTFVNRKRAQPDMQIALNDGDEVRFGDCVFTFHAEEFEEDDQ